MEICHYLHFIFTCKKHIKQLNLNVFLFWSELRGSNSQQPAWKAGVLPIELSPQNLICLKSSKDKFIISEKNSNAIGSSVFFCKF